MKRLAAALALVAILAPAAYPQITKPIRYTWIVTSSTSWNGAAAELVLAGGDRHVIVLPTGDEERPWLILRRVEEGSLYIPQDEPFSCEVFATAVDAISRFTSMDPCHGAMLLTVPDGRAIVAGLRECSDPSGKRRSMR